jgi:hypothetical protein
MAEFSWTTSEVTKEDLQNLMSQGYMTAAELATCRVPEDPASPAQHFMSEDSVCHHTDFSTLYYSSMT